MLHKLTYILLKRQFLLNSIYLKEIKKVSMTSLIIIIKS